MAHALLRAALALVPTPGGKASSKMKTASVHTIVNAARKSACATNTLESIFSTLEVLLLIATLILLLVLSGLIYQALGTAAHARRFPAPGRMVDIGARRLHLVESGGGHPTVIFESGISASSLNWTHLRNEVARFTRACAYDRASLGWSDRAASPPALSQIVDDLHALLTAARIPGPYILVGHSFGGLVVRCFARKHPRNVAGLVLIDPLPASEWLEPSPERSRMLQGGIRLSRRGAFLARLGVVRFALALFTGGSRRVPQLIAKLSSGRGQSAVSRLVGEVGKMPRETWPVVQAHWCLPKSFEGMAYYLESLPANSAEAVAILSGTPDIPTTVLSAATATPAQLADHAIIARSGRHIVVDRSAHWIHLDQPEVVVEAIREMVERTRSY